MINFIKQKNDMKKLAYIVITSSMFLTTSCVDLTQEPQSFITPLVFITIEQPKLIRNIRV